MNRRERRRNAIKERPRTVCVTEEKLQEVINKELEEIKNTVKAETVRQTVDLVMGVMVLAINNEFNFGHVRINRLIERINKQLECLNEGDLTREDIDKWCRENKIKLTG